MKIILFTTQYNQPLPLRQLFKWDDFPDAETQTFVVTVAAVSGQNQFHIGGVERPTIDLRVNSVYTFDVSDASNAGHVLEFGVQRPGLTGTIPLSTQSASGVTRNGTPGQSGATVVVQLPAYGRLVINYYCSAHSAMAKWNCKSYSCWSNYL